VLALGYKYFAPLGLFVCGCADSWDFQLKLSFAVFARDTPVSTHTLLIGQGNVMGR
jgi:hypothetical protein